MSTPWVQFLAGGIVLCLIQVLAAVPWVLTLTAEGFSFRELFRSFIGILPRLALMTGLAGLITGGAIMFEQDREFLATAGRVYGSALYIQLLIDCFVLLFAVLLVVWPQGGAVAMAAFREGVRQPLFWLVFFLALVSILIMPFVPYFTFGEDLKMVKELGYDVIMLAAGLFAVLAASISISEEIEGRTAITLMSKPVSRRKFLLGKFVGILLAALFMTALLSLAYLLILWFKPIYDKDPLPVPGAVQLQGLWLEQRVGLLGPLASFASGTYWWFYDAVVASPGLILGFCQVMVLLAIAVALATRLPMVVNLVVCLVVFFLGHLTPVLAQVSQNRFALVRFMAQLFDILLPGMEFFSIGPALTRDTLPPAQDFAVYVGSVAGYAVLYSAIALLVGLILFEDRDLA
jgi:ABC-type transport system involved in multi-copper enzyme maturation permease subunit